MCYKLQTYGCRHFQQQAVNCHRRKKSFLSGLRVCLFHSVDDDNVTDVCFDVLEREHFPGICNMCSLIPGTQQGSRNRAWLDDLRELASILERQEAARDPSVASYPLDGTPPETGVRAPEIRRLSDPFCLLNLNPVLWLDGSFLGDVLRPLQETEDTPRVSLRPNENATGTLGSNLAGGFRYLVSQRLPPLPIEFPFLSDRRESQLSLTETDLDIQSPVPPTPPSTPTRGVECRPVTRGQAVVTQRVSVVPLEAILESLSPDQDTMDDEFPTVVDRAEAEEAD